MTKKKYIFWITGLTTRKTTIAKKIHKRIEKNMGQQLKLAAMNLEKFFIK